MKTFNKLSAVALAVGLSALGLGSAHYAHADSTLVCASLSSVAGNRSDASSSQLAVVKTENLYRWQQRPWARIPEGVALHVKAPARTTAADLHNMVKACAEAGDHGSPLCVKGTVINVSRAGGSYVVRLTSDSRATASELQKRAAHLGQQ
jgi:hypothetical protein